MENEKTILNEIRLLHIAMHRGIHTMCGEPTDIPPVAGMILHFTYCKGGRVAQKDVEKEFHLRRSTACQHLQRLEKEGYITREASVTDGRVKHIVLSEKARAEQGKLAERFSAFERHIKSVFTADEHKTFFELCEKLRTHIDGIQEKEQSV